MSDRVRVLPDGVVDRIAAGEVVERPASVLKELVDNALDADATRLEITLEGAGAKRIAVSDNGGGMNREDARLALERHATSKITDAEDLFGIQTLGFRGEALPSIAAVTRLTLETCPAGGGEGTRVRIEGGERVGVDRIARGPGTTVDARSLFFNTPARRKFLKTHSTEQAVNMKRLVEFALSRVGVSWRVTHGARNILSLPAAQSLFERLVALYDPAYVDTLLPLEGSDEGVVVRGFTQRAAAAGASRRRQYVFANGRPIDAPDLVRAVLRGYRSTLPTGARPDVYLFLEVEPGDIDVNVHPTKREVRFRRPPVVAEVVEEATRSTLGAGAVAAASYRPTGGRVAGLSAPKRPSVGRVKEDGGGQTALFFSRGVASGTRKEREPRTERVAEEGSADSAAEPDVTGLTEPVLWQLHNRYILAQTGSGLAIVDQHSAHERVLYEEVIADLRSGPRPGQRLLFPIVLHLTPEQKASWESFRGLIDRLGFEIESFGGDSIAVNTVPAFRHAFDAEAALAGLLDDLGEPGRGSADMNQHERVAKLFACKAAIKAGQPLATEEMVELIDRLFATRLPYDDVHGRPAILRISLDDLDRHFGRH